MTEIHNIPDENGRRLVQLFDNILAELPAGVATLEARRTRDDRGTIVFLRPTNRESAEFSAHTDDGLCLVDVSFGRGTTFELPWEARLPADASFETMLEIVNAMALAVIAGKCHERMGLLTVKGEIQVEAKRIFRVRYFPELNWRPRIVRYQPYFPITEV